MAAKRSRAISFEEFVSGSYRTCACGEQIHPHERAFLKKVHYLNNDEANVMDWQEAICVQCHSDDMRELGE